MAQRFDAESEAPVQGASFVLGANFLSPAGMSLVVPRDDRCNWRVDLRPFLVPLTLKSLAPLARSIEPLPRSSSPGEPVRKNLIDGVEDLVSGRGQLERRLIVNESSVDRTVSHEV